MNNRAVFYSRTVMMMIKGFHTSSCYYANPAKSMKKIMGFSVKKFFKESEFFDNEILPTQQMLTKGNNECRNSRSGRRTLVLNKLFMRYITDILSTGEYSQEFLKYNIEINRVNVCADFKSLNVFWVAKGTAQDEEIELFLKKNASFLRHELSSLRVIGVVPMIHFVKDKKYSRIVEVDVRLLTADFGEDFVPTESAVKLKTKLELFSSLPTSVKSKVQELDNYLPDESIVGEHELLEMPQNVLGLNHSAIMNRITARMNKTKITSAEDNKKEQEMGSDALGVTSNRLQREEFQNFLKKRELLQTKMRKLEAKYLPDREYMKEELMERRADYLKTLDSYDEHSDEDDFVENVDDYSK